MFTCPPEAAPILVPPELSAAKLADELADWDRNAATYARRGWLLLDHENLQVTVGFLAHLPLGASVVPIMVACVRLDYSNYDLWPPSVTFLDPFTREPAAPSFGALHLEAGGPANAIVSPHPHTGRPFLCLPGVREYHAHPQHSGNHWLLYRSTGQGRLAVLCEHIWQRMARTVIGLRVVVQTLPAVLGGGQVDVAIVQGDPSALDAANRAQAAGQPQQADFMPAAGHAPPESGLEGVPASPDVGSDA